MCARSHKEAAFYHQSDKEANKIKHNGHKRHRGGRHTFRNPAATNLKAGNSERVASHIYYGPARSNRPIVRVTALVQDQIGASIPQSHRDLEKLRIAEKLSGDHDDEDWEAHYTTPTIPPVMTIDLLEMAVPQRRRGTRKSIQVLSPMARVIVLDDDDDSDELAEAFSELDYDYDEWEHLDSDYFDEGEKGLNKKDKPRERESYAQVLRR